MRLLHLLKTASPTASILGGSALALLVLKLLVLNRFPSSSQTVFDLGVLTESILSSIFASYVFYLLAVHVQYQAGQDRIRPFIARHTRKIVQIARDQLQEVSRNSRITLTLDSLTLSEMRSALARINLNEESPYMHASRDSALTWKEFFFNFLDQTTGMPVAISSSEILTEMMYHYFDLCRQLGSSH